MPEIPRNWKFNFKVIFKYFFKDPKKKKKGSLQMFPAPENIHLARCEHKTLLPNGSVWEPSGAQPQHPSMEAPRLS